MNTGKYTSIFGMDSTKPAKKFQLSVMKTPLTSRFRADENDKNAANLNRSGDKSKVGEVPKESSFLTDSQNFKLRLSDDSTESNYSYGVEKDREKSIIVVSDSSDSADNERSPALRRRGSTRFQNKKPDAVIILDSSDSDSDVLLSSIIPNSQAPTDRLKSNDRPTTSPYFDRLGSRTMRITGPRTQKCQVRDEQSDSDSTHFSLAEKKRPPMTNFASTRRVIESSFSTESRSDSDSDEARSDSSNRLVEKSSTREKSSSVSLGRNKAANVSTLRDKSTNIPSFETELEDTGVGLVKKKICNASYRTASTTMGPGTCFDSVKLTKRDAQKILASRTRLSPRSTKRSFDCETETQSTCSERNKESVPGVVINETLSSLDEDDVVENSPPRTTGPRKTHVSRFMNVPREEHQPKLSARKKNDISEWLALNTPGSSNSSGIISDSNRNSSSGNSSLERFELQHETPNNRGKISRPGTTEKPASGQNTLDRYIHRGKIGVLGDHEPPRYRPSGAETVEGKRNTGKNIAPARRAGLDARVGPKNGDKTGPVVQAVENLNIQECTDVLDKLYGNVWRKNAAALLTPTTEPRKEKTKLPAKIHNTERKPIARAAETNRQITFSSDEDDFDTFTRDIGPNLNSTTRITRRPRTTNSFIKDDSSDESVETFYTAVTNPRASNDHKLTKPRPISAVTQRIMAICDSDSESDVANEGRNSDHDNRKRLSFSEDESDTSTSEFDPGEIILPKPKSKKLPIKNQRSTKTTAYSTSVSTISKAKSFLASLSTSVPINECHPDAKPYRSNFKAKKEELCRYLFKLYNERIFDNKLPRDMSIEWSVRMRGTAGFCYNKKSIKALGGLTRSSRIVLATKVLDRPDRLRDTLVHEMCHAAAWLINNVSDGHGPFWKGWSEKAMSTFPELPPIKRCHDYKIQTKFTYRCTGCGYSIGRHSKSLDVERKRCGHCYGKFEVLINRVSKSGTFKTATPAQTRTPSEFALFVKDNYKSVKTSRRSIKHGEVMKILGQQFSAIKIKNKPDDART